MAINYNKLEKRLEEVGRLENILSLLNWDIACNIPIGSLTSRTEEMISLNKIIKKILLAPTTKKLLVQAQSENAILNSFQKANLKEIAKKIQNEEIIPEKLENNLLLAANQSELIWRTAKKNNDYELFKPYLQKVLNYKKKIAYLRAKNFSKVSLYDALLDQYDPGLTTLQIKKFFNFLKTKLPPLIQNIVQKHKNLNQSFHKPLALSVSDQKKLNHHMMIKFGFDFQKGRLDESLHPFCGGTPYDIRLTTSYNPENFLESFLGTMHETGHALYEQNLPNLYKNQPVGQARGYAFHESQSLLIEKQVVKSKEFLTYLTQFLKQEMSLQTAEWNFDDLYQQVNKVKPDFIRIYADEVTYPLHVILRFEIEEALINGKLSLDELPNIWNQKMQTYLGITPPKDSLGCLQDIHWSHGDFGYFPSYLNGAIISSMMMKNINQIEPQIRKDFIQGNLVNLNHFLNKNCRHYGSLYNHKELLFKSTGTETIQPEVFLTYLENKYLNH